MLHRLRARSRAWALVALSSLAMMGTWSSAPHGSECHDAECAVVVVAHDASAHVFQSAGPASGEQPLHCVLCHFTRTVRPNAKATFQAPPARSLALRSLLPVVSVARVFPAAQPPLRSPPAPAPLAVLT